MLTNVFQCVPTFSISFTCVDSNYLKLFKLLDKIFDKKLVDEKLKKTVSKSLPQFKGAYFSYISSELEEKKREADHFFNNPWRRPKTTMDLRGVLTKDNNDLSLRMKELDISSVTKKSDLEKEGIPFPDNFFDIVYSKSVIEHFYYPEKQSE